MKYIYCKNEDEIASTENIQHVRFAFSENGRGNYAYRDYSIRIEYVNGKYVSWYFDTRDDGAENEYFALREQLLNLLTPEQIKK